MAITWKAVLSDGSEIKQFSESGENNFSVVMENKNDIKEFIIIDNEKSYSVNFDTGEFNMNGIIINSSLSPKKFEKWEPIFWRRNKIVLMSEQQEAVTIAHIIGYQVNEDSKNYQQQFMINVDGSFVLLHKS